jgi:CheY-like chemotaxis protein
MARPRIVVATTKRGRRLPACSRPTSTVSTVGDGLAAVEAAGALYPDRVVLDISMPALNGFEAAALIRDLPDPPRIVFATRSRTRQSPAPRPRWEPRRWCGSGRCLRGQSVARRHRRPLHRRRLGGQPGGRDRCDGIAQRLHHGPADGYAIHPVGGTHRTTHCSVRVCAYTNGSLRRCTRRRSASTASGPRGTERTAERVAT